MSNFKNLSISDKPREKLKREGVEVLTDSELLAIHLGIGTKNKSVTSLATDLVEKYGTISNLVNQTPTELMSNNGIGLAKATSIITIKELVNRINYKETEVTYIKSSDDCYELVKKYANEKQENLIIINMDIRGKVINYKSVYKGTIDEMVIHPREIFNFAIANMAKSIIICHNHPSGNPMPSENDLLSTEKLVEISKVVGIKIIDHIIITSDDYYSMREKCDIIFI